MFTGIVTDVGRVRHVEKRGDTHVVIATNYDVSTIENGASIACGGICLTVVDKGTAKDRWFAATASGETLSKTTLASWKPGDSVNLERPMRVGDEFGGHIVSGHVDGVAEVKSVLPDGESVRIVFEAPVALARLIAAKGSVALDGVSLTVNDVDGARFGVNIIPHTQKVTTFGKLNARHEGQSRDRSSGALCREAREGMNVSVYHDYISKIEDVIEDARNGRMFILMDADDRENEGDLVIPAQMCTPQAVNFMARFGRGLICLALTQERANDLNIPMMTQVNGTPNQTAFTISIEAREGISTGISAHDRAHTISVAIDPTKGAADITSPGHVFPLVARHGGAAGSAPAIPRPRSTLPASPV